MGRGRARGGIWLWLAGLAVGATLFFLFARRPEGSLPVPGERLSLQGTDEITDAEKARLRGILEGRSDSRGD